MHTLTHVLYTSRRRSPVSLLSTSTCELVVKDVRICLSSACNFGLSTISFIENSSLRRSSFAIGSPVWIAWSLRCSCCVADVSHFSSSPIMNDFDVCLSADIITCTRSTGSPGYVCTENPASSSSTSSKCVNDTNSASVAVFR
jgi:hypothetical protein